MGPYSPYTKREHVPPCSEGRGVSGSWHKLSNGPSPRTGAALAREPMFMNFLGAGTAVLLGGKEEGKQVGA